ncbi:hypothetical protein [uncultured Modestobacter sp.]|uniref:hypothetical protein n=1 Tax=uncultured Modestobacter sp. TaxID=380048 RepID=UPI0026037EB8|nr:hypothetical protein [uncultured Modestobacter sp.]
MPHRRHRASGAHHCGTCPPRRPRARRVTALALAAGGAALVSTGALSSWDATAKVDSGDLTASSGETTLLDANGGAFSAAVANLLPNDYFHRYVDVRNDGTQVHTYTGTVSATGDLAGYLSVDAVTCSVPWTTVAGASICGGVQGTSLVSGASALNAPVVLTHGSIATGAAAAQHVRYTFTFASNAPSSLQGRAGKVTIAVNNTLVGGNDRTSG